MSSSLLHQARTIAAILTTTGVCVAALTLVAPAQAAPEAAAHQAQAAAKPWKPTLKVTPKRAVAGEPLTLKGKVPGGAKGQTVVVQLQYENGTKWAKVAKTQLNGKGKFVATDQPTSKLDRSYRILVPASQGRAQGTSKERFVESYGWDWLVSRTTSDESGIARGSLPINGDDYDHVLYAPTTETSAHVEITLGRKCTDLQAVFGLSDRTATGGQARITLAKDGVPALDKTFGLGDSDELDVDVTGVYRVQLSFAQVAGTPVTEPAAGAARVLCD